MTFPQAACPQTFRSLPCPADDVVTNFIADRTRCITGTLHLPRRLLCTCPYALTHFLVRGGGVSFLLHLLAPLLGLTSLRLPNHFIPQIIPFLCCILSLSFSNGSFLSANCLNITFIKTEPNKNPSLTPQSGSHYGASNEPVRLCLHGS